MQITGKDSLKEGHAEEIIKLPESGNLGYSKRARVVVQGDNAKRIGHG